MINLLAFGLAAFACGFATFGSLAVSAQGDAATGSMIATVALVCGAIAIACGWVSAVHTYKADL